MALKSLGGRIDAASLIHCLEWRRVAGTRNCEREQ